MLRRSDRTLALTAVATFAISAVIGLARIHNPGALNAADHASHVVGVAHGWDEFSGPGEIRGEAPLGLTTFDTVPGPALVAALVRRTRQVVRVTQSAPNGTYRLTRLRTDTDFIVLGLDLNEQDNAVVMDRVRAGIP